jgi:hypothetical protein
MARWLQQRVVRRREPARAGGGAAPMPVVAGRETPLLSGRLGEQRRHGVRLDQVDQTTCGSAVLVALAAWAEPGELARLDGLGVAGAAAGAAGGAAGFGARYDARQREVHAQTNRLWPRALGTTPWAMVGWLRRHVAAAGLYRVRLVDDCAPADVGELREAVEQALGAGRPVPLLVGSFVPRHYVLVLGRLDGPDGGWRVYEPTSGSIRRLDPALVEQRRLAPVLGFDRLHAALLPT